MRRTMTAILLLLTAMALGACGKKTEAQPSETETPWAAPVLETVMDENATGPEGISVVGDMYANYPEDKKPQPTEAYVEVRYFYVTPDGVAEDFDVIKGTECRPEDLVDILIKGGTLADGVSVTAYEADGNGEAVVTLTSLDGADPQAAEDQVAKAVANTFCDNLFLDQVTIKAGDKTYGPLQFEY